MVDTYKIARVTPKQTSKRKKADTEQECPPGKIYNPKTGRCIKDTPANRKKVGIELKRASKKPSKQKDVVTEQECPPGKLYNPKTGRCIKDIPANRFKLGYGPKPYIEPSETIVPNTLDESSRLLFSKEDIQKIVPRGTKYIYLEHNKHGGYLRNPVTKQILYGNRTTSEYPNRLRAIFGDKDVVVEVEITPEFRKNMKTKDGAVVQKYEVADIFAWELVWANEEDVIIDFDEPEDIETEEDTKLVDTTEVENMLQRMEKLYTEEDKELLQEFKEFNEEVINKSIVSDIQKEVDDKLKKLEEKEEEKEYELEEKLEKLQEEVEEEVPSIIDLEPVEKPDIQELEQLFEEESKQPETDKGEELEESEIDDLLDEIFDSNEPDDMSDIIDIIGGKNILLTKKQQTLVNKIKKCIGI